MTETPRDPWPDDEDPPEAYAPPVVEIAGQEFDLLIGPPVVEFADEEFEAAIEKLKPEGHA
jgi:hypothetical protein